MLRQNTAVSNLLCQNRIKSYDIIKHTSSLVTVTRLFIDKNLIHCGVYVLGSVLSVAS